VYVIKEVTLGRIISIILLLSELYLVIINSVLSVHKYREILPSRIRDKDQEIRINILCLLCSLFREIILELEMSIRQSTNL